MVALRLGAHHPPGASPSKRVEWLSQIELRSSKHTIVSRKHPIPVRTVNLARRSSSIFLRKISTGIAHLPDGWQRCLMAMSRRGSM
eukprot:6290103-Prymnesium_polylepis.1